MISLLWCLFDLLTVPMIKWLLSCSTLVSLEMTSFCCRVVYDCQSFLTHNKWNTWWESLSCWNHVGFEVNWFKFTSCSSIPLLSGPGVSLDIPCCFESCQCCHKYQLFSQWNIHPGTEGLHDIFILLYHRGWDSIFMWQRKRLWSLPFI